MRYCQYFMVLYNTEVFKTDLNLKTMQAWYQWSRDLLFYHKLPFYVFHSPTEEKKPGNSLYLIETPPRFLKEKLKYQILCQPSTAASTGVMWPNATVTKQFTEPKSVSEQKGARAESRARTDKHFLPLQQTCTFHILGTHPSARLESPLQAIRLRL